MAAVTVSWGYGIPDCHGPGTGKGLASEERVRALWPGASRGRLEEEPAGQTWARPAQALCRLRLPGARPTVGLGPSVDCGQTFLPTPWGERCFRTLQPRSRLPPPTRFRRPARVMFTAHGVLGVLPGPQPTRAAKVTEGMSFWNALPIRSLSSVLLCTLPVAFPLRRVGWREHSSTFLGPGNSPLWPCPSSSRRLSGQCFPDRRAGLRSVVPRRGHGPMAPPPPHSQESSFSRVGVILGSWSPHSLAGVGSTLPPFLTWGMVLSSSPRPCYSLTSPGPAPTLALSQASAHGPPGGMSGGCLLLAAVGCECASPGVMRPRYVPPQAPGPVGPLGCAGVGASGSGPAGEG